MNYSNKKSLYLFFIVILLVITIFALVLSTLQSVQAEDSINYENIEIAHITDVHYFPYEDCYLGDSTTDEYKNTEFYKSICGDTKLIKQAGTLLNATIRSILTEKPDYLVVSGDLTSNGEIRAHYDVANALRYLQQTMRTTGGKPNFQVFVVPGNHDVYNFNSVKYINEGDQTEDNKLGDKVHSDDYITTAEAFSIIYSGLGYPTKTVTELQGSAIGAAMLSYYSSEATSTYSYTSQYIESSIASNVSILYYSDTLGFPTASNRAQGCLSYLATINDLDYTFSMLDSSERESVDTVTNSINNTTISWSKITGGRLSKDLLNWVKTETESSRNNKDTIVGVFHHNLVPHYSMEENYTKDFTLYNYEDTAMFLADEVGVRYTFTGHMHANDRAQYVSYNGNVIQDFETGSVVSLYSPTRFTTIERDDNSSNLVEDVNSVIVKIDTLNGIKSIKIDESEKAEAQCIFNSVDNLEELIGDEIYNQLIQRVLDSFVTNGLIETLTGLVDGLNINNIPLVGTYSAAIKALANELVKQIFYDLDYNVLEIKADSLVDFVHKLVNQDSVLGLIVYSENGVNVTFEQSVLWAYRSHIAGNEPSEYGEDELMERAAKAVNTKLLSGEIVETIIKGILKPLLYADNSIVKQLLNYEFDVSSIENSSNKDKFNSLISSFIPKTDTNNPLNNGGKLVIKNLLNTNSSLVNAALGLIDESIAAQVKVALSEGVDVWAEDFIDKYMTTSFFTSIGEILANSYNSFALDDSKDGAAVSFSSNGIASSAWVHVIPETTATYESNYTYSGEGLTDAQNKPTYEDGRLPSILTSTFGDDTATSQNFVWYTNHNIGGKLIYREKNTETWTEAVVTTKIKAVEMPLIDLGLFATTTATTYEDSEGNDVTITYENILDREREGVNNSVKFAAVHYVSLTGLKSNTMYEYKVYGTYNEKEYCLQDYVENWDKSSYSFRTAIKKGDNSPFSFLAISDIQGSSLASYKKAYEAITAAQGKSEYDFIINCGDVTDNGANIKQWSYAQNELSTIFGNTSTVVAAGNHEDSDYALSSYYNFGNIGNANKQNLETGIYYSFDYSRVHFIVLNTNDASSSGLGSTQLKWLTEDLSKAKEDSEISMTIVIMHKGVYSVGSHVCDADVIALRTQLVPLFYDNGVDLVLQGHDHTYSTTQLLDRDGNVLNKLSKTKNGFKYTFSDEGVVYMTIGTIADKYYEYRQDKTVESVFNDNATIYSQLDAPMFTSITYNPDFGFSVEASAYEDGEVLSFKEYKKTLEGTNLLWLWISLGVVGGVLIGVSIYLIIIKVRKQKVEDKIL